MFDPTKREAIGEIYSEYPDGAIAEDVEGGYKLYDKIVRAAKVRVSKGENNESK